MIKAAVVGLGYWGPNLVRNFSAHPDVELVAIADRLPDRLRRVGSIYPAAAQFTDVRELAAMSPRPDLVAIATPVATHFDIARLFLEAGVHVLLEKPLAGSIEEGEELVALAQKKGLHLFVDQTFLFTGAVDEIRKQIAKASLGRLLYIDSVRINLGLFQPDVDVIWDLAPHDLSILGYILGRSPQTVAAMGSSHNPSGLLDVAYLHLDYGDSLTAHLHVSWLSPVKVRRMIFAGSAQSLIFDDLDQETKIKLYNHGVAFDVADDEARRNVLVSYRKGDMLAPAVPVTEALSIETDEIAGVLRGENTSRSTGADALEVVKILTAATRSIRSGGKAERV